MMNFDYWEGELTIYEGENVDEGEMATVHKNQKGSFTIDTHNEYKIVKTDDYKYEIKKKSEGDQ